MVKILTYLKQNKKGQGMTEYVLILAFIAGVAFMIFGNGGLKETVAGTLNKAVELIASINGDAKESKYLTAFKKWSTMDYDKLVNTSKSERIAADIDGLTNIANYFNALDMNLLDAKEFLGENYLDHIQLNSDPEKKVDGAQILQYWGTEDNESSLSKIRATSALDWMQQNYNTNYDKTYTGNWSGVTQSERYFFSDEMNSNEGSSEKKVKVAFTTDGSGNITGTRVWVTQYRNYGTYSTNTQITATDESGNQTTYSVYVPKSG